MIENHDGLDNQYENDKTDSQIDDAKLPFSHTSTFMIPDVRTMSQQFADYSNRLIQPRMHKAKILVWQDLTVNDMDLLENCHTAEEIKRELCSIFSLSDSTDPEKNQVVLDLLYYSIKFCRENNFTKAQTSAFISIIIATHKVCSETPFGNVHETFSYFKELVLCHSVKRPPFSINLFDAHQVRKMTEYVLNTYFRHFKMYKYAFTPLVRLDLGLKKFSEEKLLDGYLGLKETPPPSEKGDVEPNVIKELESENEPLPSTTTPKADVEISEAESELRNLIKRHLTNELKRVQTEWDEKLKESLSNIGQKVEAVENKGSKSGKGSKKK